VSSCGSFRDNDLTNGFFTQQTASVLFATFLEMSQNDASVEKNRIFLLPVRASGNSNKAVQTV
jgi:hypothetical protein